MTVYHRSLFSGLLLATMAILLAASCAKATDEASDTTAPADVSGLVAIKASGQVELSWTEPADADFSEVSISFAPAADGIAQPIAVSKGTTSSTISGLANGTEYAFTVRTKDKTGNASAGKVIAATPNLVEANAPADVVALAAVTSSGQVTLSWTEPTDASFAGVSISFTPIVDGIAQPIVVSKSTTSATIAGLANGTEYTFQVMAVATSGSVSAGATIACTPSAEMAVSLDRSTLAFDTPDLSQALAATVSNSAVTTVSWKSSDSYIATVSSAGLVSSVSGGTVTITATSTADPTKSATCAVTVSEPARTRATSYVDAKSITSGSVNVFMCGDSLMRTYAASSTDQCGWGQVLGQFLSSEVTVDNSVPNGGRSSRSFYDEKAGYTTASGQSYTTDRWAKVLENLKAAKAAGTPSFVFIQFGHNDQKKTTDTYGADYLTFARNNQNGTVAGTYYDYLERYIVEARELGGIPVLFTPFARAYFDPATGAVTQDGKHNISTAYANETSARGDYPAAMKEIAAKHDVPIVDLTTWSADLAKAYNDAGAIKYLYIAADTTHTRTLGALLMAKEALRALNEQGILTGYAKAASPRMLLDTNTMSFGGISAGSSSEKTFMISAFGNLTGTITVTAPSGYSVSSDGSSYSSSLSIDCASSYIGSKIYVRFSPEDATTDYNGVLTATHSTIAPDYGNTPPNATAGTISVTGYGKVTVSGASATVTWPLYSTTTAALTYDAAIDGGVSATAASLTGLVYKDVKATAIRFNTPDGNWSADASRNETRYVEFTIPTSTMSFNIDSVSLSAGPGGGTAMKWDIVYSLNASFSSPVVLGSDSDFTKAKDTASTKSYSGLGLSVAAGSTFYLRVYPYLTAAATGKSLVLANVAVSGVTY
jgi:lysophospholipase L1-like esterase